MNSSDNLTVFGGRAGGINRRKIGAIFAGALFLVASAGLAQAQSNALKKTIAVDQFLAAESTGGSVTGDGLTALLIDALMQDGRFVVVERTGLPSVQTEQNLGTSAATTAETAPKTGQLIGANVIVRGAVTKYQADAGGGGIGISGMPMGGWFSPGAGLKHSNSTLAINLRLIDTTTGQIIGTYNAEGSASSTGADAGIVSNKTGLGLSASAFRATPIGQAAEDAIRKAVGLIATGMENVEWSAQVVESNGGKIYVNAGANRNVTQGMTLVAYRKGKVLTDPSTNEVLDVELSRIGSLRVDGVREKVSTGVLVNGAGLNRGDILRLN